MGAGPSFILSTSIAAVLSSYFTESNFNKIKGLNDRRTTLIGKGQSFIWIEEAACFSVYGPCWTIWEPFNRSWNMVDLFGIIYDPLALGTKLEHYACAGPCLDTSGPFGDPTRPQKTLITFLDSIHTRPWRKGMATHLLSILDNFGYLYSIIWEPLVNFTWP